MKHLVDLRNDFRQRLVVSAAEKDGKAPVKVEEEWLREVEELERKVSLLQTAGVIVMNNKKKKFSGRSKSCRLKLRVSQKLKMDRKSEECVRKY
ncbi:hypothetical protein ACFX11_030885 [Malus domestica]